MFAELSASAIDAVFIRPAASRSEELVRSRIAFGSSGGTRMRTWFCRSAESGSSRERSSGRRALSHTLNLKPLKSRPI